MKLHIINRHQKWTWSIPSHPFEESDAIITWNDFNQDLYLKAKEAGKKYFVYQHGRYAMDDYNVHNKPTLADGYFVWSRYDYNRMKKLVGDRVLMTGSHWLDLAKSKYRNRTEYKVLCYPMLHWDTRILKENIVAIKETLKSLKDDQKLIIRYFTQQEYEDYKPHLPELESSIGDINNPDNIKNLIEECTKWDKIVSPRESTLELLAELTGCKIQDYGAYGMPNRLYGRYVPLIKSDYGIDYDIEPAIKETEIINFVSNILYN